jgi:hypothetical protein
MFISFRFEAKQNKKTFFSFRLGAKRKNQKQNEAKQQILGSKTKRKYGVFVSLWVESEKFEAKRSKMKRKKNYFFSHERAKRMRNGSRFASFRFEAKKCLKRNRRTLLPGLGFFCTCSELMI